MREIKFRCFCEKHNKEEEYSLGDLIIGEACTDNGEGGIFKNWRQYTGLKDKNGVEIYEGDIIKGHFNNGFTEKGCDTIRVVGFNEEYFAFMFKEILPHKSEKYNMFMSFDKENEVIGNIYENSELLNNQ